VLRELELAGEQGLTTRDLMALVNLGMGRLEAMMKILDVEGAVGRSGNRWHLIPGADWAYDGERYAQVTAMRRSEQRAMAAFGADGRCLMRALQQELDDPGAEDCGRCSVCTSPRYAEPLDPGLVEQAERYLRSRPIELDAKKMAPDATGAMRKIPEDVRVGPGWALARVGDGGWWPAIERGLREGSLDADIVNGLAELLRNANQHVDWVTSVPSVRLEGVLAHLAGRLAAELGVAHPELIARREQRPPQVEMANAAQQTANVRGAFRLIATPPAGTGILLDDTRHSGWTLAMVGGQLRRAGAQRIVPLVLGTVN